jgi:predicted Zn-dependent peptidase
VVALWLGVIFSIAASSARAQSEHAPVISSRGDKHSEGWAKAMRLKGAPLPPKFPKVGQEIERVVLDNGLIVYMMEDHRLPLVDAQVIIRTGTYYATADELRIPQLTAEIMRSGGTKNLPPDQLEERLDFIAASLAVSMGAEQANASLNVPQKDTAEGMRILADVLRNPTFDESRLELAKNQMLRQLRASNDQPGSILEREFRILLYTPAHPAGRIPTFERIQKIQRDDLVRFHQRFFHPNQMMLGVTGDFNKAEMLATIKQLFGDWPRQDVQLPPLPKVNPQPKPGVYYVPKAVNQSSFWLVHWGTNRDNPDRFAIDLMNDILGGSSFSSRVAERVRNDEGLAYSVGTSYNTNLRDINFFLAAAQTRTDATVRAIQSTLDEIRKMRAERISRNEFDTAKEIFLYSQVFRFNEPSQSLGALMGLEYENLPQDYLEKEFAGYQAVTAADIERVAREYLKPDELSIIIVGDVEKFKGDLPALGTVNEITPFQFDPGAAAARPAGQ